jgi:uncharacterized membrane-anchored protein YhcB (DUF1043 family)
VTKKEADDVKRHFDKRAADIRRHFDKEATDVKRHFDKEAGDLRRHFDKEATDVKRHFDVVAEHMGAQQQQLAEGIDATNERIDRLETEVRRGFSEMGSLMKLSYGQLDRRLTRVEVNEAETRAEVENLKTKLAS